MQRLSSATTGLLSQASAGAKRIGTAPSETVSASLPAVASDRLMAATPAKVDQALEAWLLPQVASCLRSVTIDRTTQRHGFDQEFVRFEVVEVPGANALAEVREALRRHVAACLPAPDERVVKELAALRVTTKSRPEADEDIDFALRIYAEKLRDYPADIVLEVLRTQPSHSKFWPAWQELQERLEWRAKKRRARRDALAALLDRMEGEAA